jgi:hypothetical protein
MGAISESSFPEMLISRTKVERLFDPDAVRRLKANAEFEIAVEGSEFASQATAYHSETFAVHDGNGGRRTIVALPRGKE